MTVNIKGVEPAKGSDTPDIAAMVGSPDVAAAIAQAVQQQVAAAVAAYNAGTPVADATSLATLAQLLGGIVSQGSGKVVEDPKVMQIRKAAGERCFNLIRERRAAIKRAQAEGRSKQEIRAEWPRYRVVMKCFLGDQVVQPYYRDDANGGKARPTEIIFDFVPNRAMVPMNEYAAEIYEAFHASIDGKNPLLPPADDLFMTPEGLVIIGASAGSETRLGKSDGTDMFDASLETDFYQGRLRVTTTPNPDDESVHILGTNHPAARQHYFGDKDPAETFASRSSNPRLSGVA
jgi:hypothetical protein